MEHEALAQVAAVLGGLGSAAVLLARGRVLLVAGFGLLAAAETGLIAAIVPAGDLGRLAESPKITAVLIAGLVVVVVAGVFGLGSRPGIVPVMLLAVAPFRVPTSLGDQEGFLLIPLYIALCAAGVELVVRSLRRSAPVAVIPRVLAIPASAFTGLSAISLMWSYDPSNGTIELLFFLFPFAALVAVVARAPFLPWLPRALAVTMVALAAIFAAIGLFQAITHWLIFEESVERGNAFASYFRVTSLFKDPSLYARELVLAIVMLVVALWLERVRFALGAALVALLWAGLFVSYSQSAMVALIVAVVVVTLLAPTAPRRALLLGIVGAALVAAVVLAVTASGHSIDQLTRDRSTLVEVTAPLVSRHPVIGVGVGGQQVASRDEAGGYRNERRNASHTTPLTVAAELGAVGLLTFGSLLAGAVALLRSALRTDFAFGLTVVGVFIALFAHSLFYSGFFENPTMWGTLAATAALLNARGARARAPVVRCDIPAVHGRGAPAR